MFRTTNDVTPSYQTNDYLIRDLTWTKWLSFTPWMYKTIVKLSSPIGSPLILVSRIRMESRWIHHGTSHSYACAEGKHPQHLLCKAAMAGNSQRGQVWESKAQHCGNHLFHLRSVAVICQNVDLLIMNDVAACIYDHVKMYNHGTIYIHGQLVPKLACTCCPSQNGHCLWPLPKTCTRQLRTTPMPTIPLPCVVSQQWSRWTP